MRRLTRRTFLAGAAAVAAWSRLFSMTAAQEATAPDASFRQAFALRRSTRVYGSQPISDTVLMDLLEAANGINRSDTGGRTAPSWRGAMDVDIYVATAEGVSLFEPDGGMLVPVGATDIRASASPQPFAGTGPVLLIYVSDRKRLIEAAGMEPDQELDEAAVSQYRITAFVDSAIVAQNVYLYCAAMGLGTCLVGGNDPERIAAALELEPHQVVTYIQPVGHMP